MKCDQVLSSLTTGGAVARWRAQRHLARCLRCAEAHSQLREITRQLAEAPPLTAAQRALWAASGIEPTAPRIGRLWAYPVGLAAATVVVGAVGLYLWQPRLGDGQARPNIVHLIPQPPSPSPVEPTGRSQLADEMLARVDRLDRELAELRRQGDLLDVRKDADALWERYARRKPSTL